ncbi:MAG: hypothetical protein ABI229_05445 [Gemmatimonadaceae bacterium]
MKTIFAIIGVGQPDALAPVLEVAYPDSERYKLAEGQWLVADAGTAMDVSTKLRVVGDGSPSTAVVITMGGYFGRYAAPLWEWIKAKQSPNG